MGRHRIRKLAGAAAGAAMVAVAFAAAMLPGVASAAPRQAMVRIAHFSPDAEYVDVYVVTLNRQQMFPNVFYKNVSAYWAVSPGPFTYEVRPAGVPATTKPVVRLTGDLEPGASYTVVAVGKKTDLNAVLLSDDMSPTGRDSTKVRFLDAAVDLPPLDIAVAGKVVSAGVSFPSSTGYQQLPTGRVRLEARRAGGAEVLIRDELSLKAGTVNSVALIGGAGQPREAFRFADATGVRTMPSGALRTGGGGTAPLPQPAGTPAGLPATAGRLLTTAGMAAGLPATAGTAAGLLTAAGMVAGLLATAGVAALGGAALALAALAWCGVRAPLGPELTVRRRGPARLGLAAATAALALLLGACAQRTAAGAGAPGSAPAPATTIPAVPAPPDATASAPPDATASAPPDASASTASAASVLSASAKALRMEVAPLPSQVTSPGPPSPPVRVSIPVIGVRSSLVRLGLATDGSMEVPVRYGQAGWFAQGTLPGETGPAVIAGHLDSERGPAVFYRLRDLRRGDTIQVDRADGVRLRFVVEERVQYPKASFPPEAVFGPVPWATLRLVTCGGEFDRARRSYRDNVVVYARLAGSSR
ncbi:MAG TPA: class F sortase [Actinomycetes bacterium]|nr:class F sortase [Actinomycetes bacterium]